MGREEGMGPRPRLHEGRLCARIRRGALVFAGGGMGWRMREDNGRGARSCSRGEGWVGGFASTRDGGGFGFAGGGYSQE